MTATLLPPAKVQFLDLNGAPLAGGHVYTFIPATTTPKTTWQDAAQAIQNTNPIVLDERGEAIIWGAGTYREVLYAVDENNIETLVWDQITTDGSVVFLLRDLSNPNASDAQKTTFREYIGATLDGLDAQRAGLLGIDVRDYGAATTNTAAQNSIAFGLAAQAIEDAGGGVLTVPPGIYLWGSQTFAGATGQGFAYKGRSLIEIYDCVNPVVLNLEGVTFKTGPTLKFGAFNPVTGASFASTAPFTDPDYKGFIGFPIDVRGNGIVAIFGYPALDGNITNQTIGGVWTNDPGDTTGRQLDHDGLVAENNEIFYAEIGSANNFGRDGAEIGWVGMTTATEAKPHVLNIREALFNGRNALSYIGGNSLVINSPNFSHSGKNGVVQSRPGAGIDIEAESSICRGLVVNNPFIFDNFGVGIVDDSGDDADWTVNGGLIVGTTSYSIWNVKPRARLNEVIVVGAVAHMYGDAANPKNSSQAWGCTFSLNVADSPNGVVYTTPGQSNFDAGPSEFYGCAFDAGAFVLPLSIIANDVHYSDCTFVQTGSGMFSTQGTFTGFNKFTVNAAAIWNNVASLKNLGTIQYNGTLYTRSEQTLVLVNAANNNVALPTGVGPITPMPLVVNAPTANFNITGFVPTGPSGQQIIVLNNSNHTMTLSHANAGSLAANRIFIGGAADLAISNFGSATLTYSGSLPGWYVSGVKV